MSPCNHEEADTRLLLHAADAAKQGYRKIMIQTVDTDVVVLAISMVQDIDVDELWVSIGVGKHLRYLAVDKISKSLGKNKARALQGFHAFTGCDQTSAFAAKGKKTAWETWKSFDQVTSAFEAISEIARSSEMDALMPVLERYVVLLYDRTSTCQSEPGNTFFSKGEVH